MNKEEAINIINTTLKKHFDYVPLDTTLKVTETLIEKGVIKVDEENNLKVCAHCLAAIESREGKQVTRTHYIDEDDTEAKCEWCEETEIDILYELL